jgi:diguanylate cyclase (GGDEF)-like protein
MRKIVTQLKKQVPNDFQSIETERQRIQYNLIFLIGSMFLAAFSLASFLNNRYETAYFIFGCLVSAVAINVFALKNGHRKIAAWTYSSVLLVLVIYLILSGGVESTGPLWTYPIVVIIISLLGHLHGFFLSMFTVAVMAVMMGYGDIYGLTPLYSETFKIRFIATMFALTTLVWSLEYSRARSAAMLLSLNNKILNISRRDQLTGLLNRRGLEERFNSEVNRANRNDQSFCLALLDIDDFKFINDRYGHLAGDSILRLIADEVQSEIRNIDTLARWGGEEFIVLIDKSNLEESLYVAEKIRKVVQNSKLEAPAIKDEITISIGLAEYKPGQSLLELFDIADNALYLAKRQGKNCIKTVDDVLRQRIRPDLTLA